MRREYDKGEVIADYLVICVISKRLISKRVRDYRSSKMGFRWSMNSLNLHAQFSRQNFLEFQRSQTQQPEARSALDPESLKRTYFKKKKKNILKQNINTSPEISVTFKNKKNHSDDGGRVAFIFLPAQLVGS